MKVVRLGLGKNWSWSSFGTTPPLARGESIGGGGPLLCSHIRLEGLHARRPGGESADNPEALTRTFVFTHEISASLKAALLSLQ